ncbi:hypothetical protein BHE74_00008957 [Ensete ventricosum]|nr:hypothetical protein BHE74_00008957 [Ensete ventricosum]
MGNVAFVCAVLTRGSSFQETPWRSIDGSFGEEGVSDEGVGPVQVLSITSRAHNDRKGNGEAGRTLTVSSSNTVLFFSLALNEDWRQQKSTNTNKAPKYG